MLRLAWRTCGEAAGMGAKAIACCGVARSDKSLASLLGALLVVHTELAGAARMRGARAGRAARSQATWQTKCGRGGQRVVLGS